MPGPEHLAAAGQLVEVGRLVVDDPAAQDQRLQGGGGYGAAGELVDHGQHAVEAARPSSGSAARGGRHLLPGEEEPPEGLGLDRLDLLAEPGQGPAPQSPEHLGVAPLVARTGRAELAVEDASLPGQPLQRVPDDCGPEAEAGGDLVGGERTMRAGEARHEVGERVLDGVGERVGGAGRHRDAESVAQAADVLDGRPPLPARHPHLDDAAAPGECLEPALHVGAGHASVAHLVGAEGSEETQQVGQPFGVAGMPVGGQPLELALDLGEHLGVEQLAQLGAAEQLGEQPLVEREGGGPTLGDGRVALVDELGDVPEEQGAGVRRRLLGVDVDHRDLAAVDAAHQGDEGRQVVDVLEALADRFQDDREGGVLGGDLEQLGGALALLPERAAASRVAAGQEQGPGGALAEAGREERGPADLVGDHRLDLVGLEDDDLPGGRLGVGLGDAHHDAVVGGHRLGVDAVALAQPGVDGQRPGGVHGCAVGGVHHQPPVAELVAEPLDEDGGVAGHDLGRRHLLAHVAHQVGGRVVVQAAVAGPRLGGRRRQRRELTGEGADGLAELGGPAERVALPERQPPGNARRGSDQDPVVGDVLDPPAGGAEREDVTDPRLVDHLLVELADPPPRP